MNAPLNHPIDGDALLDEPAALAPWDAPDTRPAVDRLAGYCQIRGDLIAEGILTRAEAAAEMQAVAEHMRLPDAIGQDDVTAIMAETFDAPSIAPGPPLTPEPPQPAPRPYRTPQATIDAFFYVVGLDDPPRLAAWLADHPRDAAYVRKLLEQKCSIAVR